MTASPSAAEAFNERLYFHHLPTPSVDQTAELLSGLTAPQKFVSPKYFYDERGSELFDQITRVKEYYPTRMEHDILSRYARQICHAMDEETVLVEPGSGTSDKVRYLLEQGGPGTYAPIEISKECLLSAASSLTNSFPELTVHAICADFTRVNQIPEALDSRSKTAFFPGSTIGNFEREDAISLLTNIHSMIGQGSRLLIGVDLVKSINVLHAAYNDKAGVTATFNLNLLHHIGLILGASFDIDKFEHQAFFNPDQSRIEMHLKCNQAHLIKIGDQEVYFKKDETIHTENSYKYTVDEFEALAGLAGFKRESTWLDPQGYFSFHCFEAVQFS